MLPDTMTGASLRLPLLPGMFPYPCSSRPRVVGKRLVRKYIHPTQAYYNFCPKTGLSLDPMTEYLNDDDFTGTNSLSDASQIWSEADSLNFSISGELHAIGVWVNDVEKKTWCSAISVDGVLIRLGAKFKSKKEVRLDARVRRVELPI